MQDRLEKNVTSTKLMLASRIVGQLEVIAAQLLTS